MFQITSLIDHYNELALTDNLGADSWDVLAPALQEHKVVFGNRPLCTVVRPLFHTRRGWDYLRHRTELILQVFAKLTDAALADPALRAQIHLTPMEEEMIQLPTGYRTTIPTARSTGASFHPPRQATNAATSTGTEQRNVAAGVPMPFISHTAPSTPAPAPIRSAM